MQKYVQTYPFGGRDISTNNGVWDSVHCTLHYSSSHWPMDVLPPLCFVNLWNVRRMGALDRNKAISAKLSLPSRELVRRNFTGFHNTTALWCALRDVVIYRTQIIIALDFVPRDGRVLWLLQGHLQGRDPLNQNFRKFRSKTKWIGSVQTEKFRKNGSTFRGGPLYSVGPVR